MPVRSTTNNSHAKPLTFPQGGKISRSYARDEIQTSAGEDYYRRPHRGAGREQRVLAKLLKAAGYQPKSETDYDRGAERDYRTLAAERDCQRHSDQSHHDHAEWGRVFPL